MEAELRDRQSRVRDWLEGKRGAKPHRCGARLQTCEAGSMQCGRGLVATFAKTSLGAGARDEAGIERSEPEMVPQLRDKSLPRQRDPQGALNGAQQQRRKALAMATSRRPEP
jgi:hypothetical protein